MYLKTRGLVLRLTVYNDHDALLTLLTDHHSKITVKARGLRRKNSPLTAACQLLAFSEFTLFENRGMYVINEAQTIELFHNLRKDLQKLSLGTYFAQVADIISQEDQQNPELLRLTLNSLYVLSDVSANESLIKSVFEFRVACLAGYEPDLSGCRYCGCMQPDLFNITDGQLECSQCSKHTSDGLRMPIIPGVLDVLRYLAACDEKRIFAFKAGESTIHILSNLTESYLSTQLERGFSALDFYKSLFFNNYLGENNV